MSGGGGIGGVGGDVAGGGVAVLDELVEVFGGQGAEIAGEVGLAADGAAGAHELVEAVAIVFLLVPEGGAIGAFRGGADAVAPVVGVGEAAAGPAKDGGLHGLHGVDEVEADAVKIGDLGFFADPDAVIDDAAELLDEVGVDFGGDGAEGFRRKDVDGGVGGGRGGLAGGVAREGGGSGGEGRGLEEAAAIQRGHGNASWGVGV